MRRAQSRQPATSASLPTNRHARLRLCAVLSVSAAEAGRRGTATAAPRIFPGMRLSVATPLFVSAMLWHPYCMLFPAVLFLGRGCWVFFCSSRSLYRSAGQQVLVNTHSQRRRICKNLLVNRASSCTHLEMFALRQMSAELPLLLLARRGCALAAVLRSFLGENVQRGNDLDRRLSSKHDR